MSDQEIIAAVDLDELTGDYGIRGQIKCPTCQKIVYAFTERWVGVPTCDCGLSWMIEVRGVGRRT